MKFSVVIPTYNRRHCIGPAIDSVLSQADVDLEIIIVDDGSTDGTLEWLAEQYTDPRIRVLPNVRSKGPAGARNTGILAATSDFIAFLDSDDSYLPGHLAACQRIFHGFPEVGVIYGRALYEQNGKPVDYMGPNFERKLSQAVASHNDDDVIVFSRDYFTHLLEYGCYFNLSTVALRAPAARSLMNETLRIAEDYEYWVRLSRHHLFACLKQPQIRYQLHDENISFEQAETAADNTPSLIKAYQIILDYPRLNARQIHLLHRHMAEVLFSWAYRCRTHQELREAAHLHLQSFRYGSRVKNVIALLKLIPISLYPARRHRR